MIRNDTKPTIEKTLNENLCTGCGTCTICPNEAIELKKEKRRGIYLPKLNEKYCNYCGICYNICPGHAIDFKELNMKIFGREPKDVLLGNYLNCYAGYASDYDIRYNSASGGLVTQLLLFALEEGLIDGALVTRMKKDNPLEPEPFIAKTRDEIIEASKSKYCPVPANIMLKQIIKERGKFAVVGLPCHIEGIRKAELVYKKLREKIILHLGLFCSNVPSFLATEFLIQNMKIDDEITEIEYRGGGWPGRMKIVSKNGYTISIPTSDYWGSGFGTYFSTMRCKLCIDHTCELSDISFGDAWLPEFLSDKSGWSIVISRTKLGEEILQNAALRGKIKLVRVNSGKVVQSQGKLLKFKKSDLSARKLLSRKIPAYNSELLKPKLDVYLNCISLRLGMALASKRLWTLLRIYVHMLKYAGLMKKSINRKDY